MRIPTAVALVASFVAGAVAALAVTTERDEPDYSEFFAELDAMQSVSPEKRSADTFVIDTASWNETRRRLSVRTTMSGEKGTLLTLTGVPASTWVHAWKISAGYAAEFELHLPAGQAVPCEVTIRSAFAAETVKVDHAPSACGRPLRIEGAVTTETGLPVASERVIVTVGDNDFTTTTDADSFFALDVYSDSDDARVTIRAEATVGNERRELRLYEGSIVRLKGIDKERASIWATELFGRRYGLPLLASMTSESLQHP